MLENLEHHEKTKYIDIDYHFSRHHYVAGLIQLVYIKSSKQLVDIFTKPLRASVFYTTVFKLNLEYHHV